MKTHGLERVSSALAVALAAILIASAGPAKAQSSWPDRAVRLIVPVAAGSGADVSARLVGERLARAWARPVVVDNRPGGDSVVAITAVIGAADDHVLLWGPATPLVTHPFTHARLPYDARALVPVVRVATAAVLVGAANGIRATTMAELVVEARGAPGKLRWASVSGLVDLLFQAFVKEASVPMERVSYRDPAQAAGDLAEGRVQAYPAAYAIVRPLVESGRIRPLAFANAARVPLLPGVSTVRESGFAILELDPMIGAFAIRTTSETVRARISADVRAALQDPLIGERMAAAGQLANAGDAASFAAAIETQRGAAANAARIVGIRPAE